MIILGGIVGAIIRTLIYYIFKTNNPINITIIVNAMASFLLGITYEIYNSGDHSYDFVYAMTATLSTFSTYGLEVLTDIKKRHYKNLFYIISMNHAISIVAFSVGYYLENSQ